MGNYQYVDIFATKGLEYLFVIGFLLTLVAFWKFLNKTSVPPAVRSSTMPPASRPWFRIVDGLYFHQGHSWARVEDKETVVIGMDDFAQKLVGEMSTIHLPGLGEDVHQGTSAWEIIVDSKSIPMRSPVSGRVVAVNEGAKASPKVVNDDPYEKGWLMKVRPRDLQNDVTNLLSGKLARAWMDQTIDSLRARASGNLGMVLQDGGIPVLGIAKNLSQNNWHEIASEFLLDVRSKDEVSSS